jgi:glycosyltransferase involved in cell wall biosynthesis
MTILHISTRMILGGSQRHVVMTCAAQVAQGHEVWLAFGPIYGPEGSLMDAAIDSGARLVEMPSLRRPPAPAHDIRCYRQLRRLIRAARPDVVHTHSSKAGILGRAAAWAENVPAVVHTVHGVEFHDHQPKIIKRAYVALERWAAKRCHKIVGVSEAMREVFRAERIGRPDQLEVIMGGIDLHEFHPSAADRATVRRELGISDAAPVIGMVARLDPLKGQADLLSILPELAHRFPQLRMLLVGDGWYRAELERRAELIGVLDRTIFTGVVPLSRVRQLLGAMDVVALPSYNEAQGLALIEALLCGSAIVAYDVGGIGEVCINDVTGRLVPVGDREALSDAILWLFEDDRRRHELAARGREYAISCFDHRTMVARIEDLYRSILEKRTLGLRT